MEKDMMVPSGSRTFTLKVDSYADGELKGTLHHARLGSGVRFGSFMSLAVIIEDMMDLEACPRETEHAVFAPPQDPPPLATFDIEILFRQNHSWQGRLIWKEEKQEANFRSALELMFLLDSILAE